MTASLALGIIIAHFVGDYLLQSHWMANEKTKRWWPAAVHGFFYTLPYALLLLWFFDATVWVFLALIFIGGTHAVIDRYRLAKHVGWLKNQIGPKSSRPTWDEAMANGGYNASTPIWLSSFLLFVTDNTMHIILNTAAVIALLLL